MVRGLSPRVRGKHAGGVSLFKVFGSIPACAGEAPGGPGGLAWSRVYPRVCGGSDSALCQSSVAGGLSPRVRGKQRIVQRRQVGRRSIPACAGEAPCEYRIPPTSGVYPRVCGGSTSPSRNTTGIAGLSPRVRGKRPPPRHRRHRPGLSPRVRGKPANLGFQHNDRGSIPACAGEATRHSNSPYSLKVYPRVCGGSVRYFQPTPMQQGLSPRVRGKPGHIPIDARPNGSIPACAGEAYLQCHCGSRRWVYPRVCGGSSGATAGLAR